MVANHKTMSEYARLSGMLPPGLESIIREYAHPVHRKPEHGIMMTNLFNIIKKPIVKKIRDLIDADDAKRKCDPEFLYDRELGNLFNNPLEHTQYASKPYNEFIKRYDSKALRKLLQRVKKKMTKPYCKMKNKPYNKNVSVKDVVKINTSMKKFNHSMKFYNNIDLINERISVLHDQLIAELVNNGLVYVERPDIRRELSRLLKVNYGLIIKMAKTKKERRAITILYFGNRNMRYHDIIGGDYPYVSLWWDDICDHTHYYGYIKNTKAMKRANSQRYQLNHQKRSCIYAH